MSVVSDLEKIRQILLDLAEKPNCAEITHYNTISIKLFIEGLEKAIRRYKNEAIRVKKYYRR